MVTTLESVVDLPISQKGFLWSCFSKSTPSVPSLSNSSGVASSTATGCLIARLHADTDCPGPWRPGRTRSGIQRRDLLAVLVLNGPYLECFHPWPPVDRYPVSTAIATIRRSTWRRDEVVCGDAQRVVAVAGVVVNRQVVGALPQTRRPAGHVLPCLGNPTSR